ncbi:hypothetical protein [Herbaspirillum frisingense]|uniref:hypothetical protein n=1 Tax=Herbaspirillum frisingense TaxID=92645 RepID=UPI001F1EE561|nr:hypothetical protein [Herbaspirillum frisingense]UIN20799.1 hypothetical protein LAZ82_20370 [Herbaspirillum frisingense]
MNGTSIQWYSRKGGGRRANCDASGTVIHENYVFAIVADGAETKGERPSEYIAHWIQLLLAGVAREAIVDEDAVIRQMKASHEMLRRSYPAEIASYGALLLDREGQRATMFCCGDCRIGLESSEQAEPVWLSPVHSLANWRGEDFTHQHLASPFRGMLTKSLNSRFFHNPEVLGAGYKAKDVWILATDGYWADHKMEMTLLSDVLDDTSCLRISFQKDILQLDTDCNNFYR